MKNSVAPQTSIWVDRLSKLSAYATKLMLLCLLLTSTTSLAQTSDRTQVIDVVKKVYNSNDPAPEILKPYLSPDFYALYQKCYSVNEYIGWALGYWPDNPAYMANPVISSITPTNAVVKATLKGDNMDTTIDVKLIKQNGVWLIDDVIDTTEEVKPSSKASMRDYLARPHG